MGHITVTAPNGIRARVRVQEQETHTNNIPEVRNSTGELLAAARTETYESWVDKSIDTFASEARAFDVGPKKRIIVEDNPA